jgi:glycerophosphoryl diester phosphodiesterase
MSRHPAIIAHRGASGYLPEHTLEGKALAHGMGADFLEQDVVATRDGQLVVLHDVYLEDVTDVVRRFPSRHRADGHYYVIDFDLRDLQELRVSERRRAGSEQPLFEQRFPLGGIGFRIATLDDEIQLIQGLNHSTGRNVGLYPEIKNPLWHSDNGIDLARLLLEKLSAYGYKSYDDPVFVQCFDSTELQRVRGELSSSLKLVQLVADDAAYRELLTPSGLVQLSQYAQGLGPAYSQLLNAGGRRALTPSLLMNEAREAGLLLHPYTFRRDRLPDYADGLEDLLTLFISELRVDGLFCDHPDVAVRVREQLCSDGK